MLLRAMLLAGLIALTAPAQVLINEADCNQGGTDTAEFVEIYDGGTGNAPLDNLTLVFYNGASNSVYAAFDLTGYTTNDGGYFVAGNAGLSPAPDLVFPADTLQNGTDAIALYLAPVSNFPIGQALTTDGLIDALVYTTGQARNLALEVLLGEGQEHVDEDGGASSDLESMQRCPDGSGGARNTATYTTAPPTPGAPNDCAALVDVVINEVDVDDVDADDREFIELFDGGGGETSLNGLVLVLYNGGDDSAYAVYNLQGKKTDTNGYFIIGSAALSPELLLNAEGIQNGADAIALYFGNINDFSVGMPLIVTGLVDAVVYGTSDGVDNGLLPLLNASQPQVDENALGNAPFASMQRCPNGLGGVRNTDGYEIGTPTPGAPNDCPDSPPVADFTWSPLTAYAGQPVNFTDLSTGPPDAWTWTFNGAAIPAAFVQNPAGIEFVEAGFFDVQLSVSNTLGVSATTRYITVLDPAPSATGIVVSPDTPATCAPLTFLAFGVLGRPPLSYTWDLINAGNNSFYTGTGNPLNFSVPGNVPAGTYRARLTLENSAGTATILSNTFSVSATAGAALELTAAGPLYTNINNIPIDAAFSLEVDGFSTQDIVVMNATVGLFTGGGANYGFELVPLAEGDVTVSVPAGAASDDVCGLPTLASNTVTIHYDVTQPTITLEPLVNGINTSAPVQFTLSASETLQAPLAAAFNVTNGSVSAVTGSGAAYTIDVTPLANGIVGLGLLSTSALDLAGNPAESSVSAQVEYISAASEIHNADQNGDNLITLSELLRVIQFYNFNGYHCEAGTEDGFAPALGSVACAPHASDYSPQDWKISLSELLRLIQFYNLGGYYRCDAGTEDQFCPGPPPV